MTAYRQRGMTLVELLVVFTIIGLLTALVAPVGGDVMARAQSQEEWMRLDRTLEGLAFKAYAEGRVLEIDARGTRLAWKVDGSEAGFLNFEHIFFEGRQTIVINSNGVADRSSLSLRQRGRPRQIKLNRWLLES
jgi:prepilin-type N-terminal cleavage/methylation domain-containing protein